MWRDSPGAWIAIGVSLLFRGDVALLMHRVIVKVLKNGSTEPSDHE
jgi:hypothetical protein